MSLRGNASHLTVGVGGFSSFLGRSKVKDGALLLVNRV